MRNSMKLRGLALLVGIMVMVAVVGVQVAAGKGAITVRGDQLIEGADACPDADEGTYLMKGDLVGCWYTVTFNVVSENPGGGFRASGTEHFVGCINTNGNGTCDAGEPTGEFDTTFTFSAKYAPTGDEIHGRCHHPIVSGSGGFSGASGVLSFKDIPSEGRFPYHGNVQL